MPSEGRGTTRNYKKEENEIIAYSDLKLIFSEWYAVSL